METSLEKSPSPSPSSGSDDFAALLDAELLTDRQSTASDTSQDENLRSEQNVEEEEAEVEDSDVEEEEQEDGLGVIGDLEVVLQVNEEDDLLDSGGGPLQDFRYGIVLFSSRKYCLHMRIEGFVTYYMTWQRHLRAPFFPPHSSHFAVINSLILLRACQHLPFSEAFARGQSLCMRTTPPTLRS